MSDVVRANLNRLIASLESRLEKAKAIRSALDDPELRDELTGAFLGYGTPTGVERPAKKKPTQFDRIVEFVRSCADSPPTTPEIREKTGLSRGAIGSILHTHKDVFEKLSVPGNKKLRRWRLRNGAV